MVANREHQYARDATGATKRPRGDEPGRVAKPRRSFRSLEPESGALPGRNRAGWTRRVTQDSVDLSGLLGEAPRCQRATRLMALRGLGEAAPSCRYRSSVRRSR